MIAMMKRDQEKEKKHHEIRQSITSVKFSQSFMLVLLHDNLNCPSCSSHFRSGHAPLSCASYWQHHTPLSTAITPLSSCASHTFWFSRCYKLTTYLLTYLLTTDFCQTNHHHMIKARLVDEYWATYCICL